MQYPKLKLMPISLFFLGRGWVGQGGSVLVSVVRSQRLMFLNEECGYVLTGKESDFNSFVCLQGAEI